MPSEAAQPTIEETIRAWVDLTGVVLAAGIPAANIKWALDRWGASAAELYPMAEDGEPVSLTTEALDGALENLPDDLAEPFLGLTLICLFEGADGPAETAIVLQDAVDDLDADIKRQEAERGEDN